MGAGHWREVGAGRIKHKSTPGSIEGLGHRRGGIAVWAWGASNRRGRGGHRDGGRIEHVSPLLHSAVSQFKSCLCKYQHDTGYIILRVVRANLGLSDTHRHRLIIRIVRYQLTHCIPGTFLYRTGTVART